MGPLNGIRPLASSTRPSRARAQKPNGKEIVPCCPRVFFFAPRSPRDRPETLLSPCLFVLRQAKRKGERRLRPRRCQLYTSISPCPAGRKITSTVWAAAPAAAVSRMRRFAGSWVTSTAAAGVTRISNLPLLSPCQAGLAKISVGPPTAGSSSYRIPSSLVVSLYAWDSNTPWIARAYTRPSCWCLTGSIPDSLNSRPPYPVLHDPYAAHCDVPLSVSGVSRQKSFHSQKLQDAPIASATGAATAHLLPVSVRNSPVCRRLALASWNSRT
mmetsp:Transcript_29552/g.66924  ORF Transcript_29552/g.66924 Transcript_29552/m.66924 type:complete len:270 (+) Transcript_29552:32-841(+)